MRATATPARTLATAAVAWTVATSGAVAHAADGPADGRAPADPRAGAIGLLALPEVYGTEPCQRFRARPVPVYATPAETAPVGEIRTTSPWRPLADAGCEGLRVDFASAGGEPAELPAQEYGSEAPAAIVLEARGDWYRVRLPVGDGWVHAAAQDEFVPLSAALPREPGAFTSPAAVLLRSAPQGDAPVAWGGRPVCTVPRVRGFDDAHRWIEVELTRDECCTDDAPVEPRAGLRGWLPAYRDDGVPSVWFAPRGC